MGALHARGLIWDHSRRLWPLLRIDGAAPTETLCETFGIR